MVVVRQSSLYLHITEMVAMQPKHDSMYLLTQIQIFNALQSHFVAIL